MAVTISVPTKGLDVWGKQRVRVGTVTFDNSYDTGGEAITAAQFGLAEIVAIVPIPRGSGWVVVPNAAKTKLLVLHGDYDAIADGPLIEVPAATNLSALVVDVIVIGI